MSKNTVVSLSLAIGDTLYIRNDVNAPITTSGVTIKFCGPVEVDAANYKATGADLTAEVVGPNKHLTLTNVGSAIEEFSDFAAGTFTIVVKGGAENQGLEFSSSYASDITVQAAEGGLTMTGGTKSVATTDNNDKYTIDGLTIDNTVNTGSLSITLHKGTADTDAGRSAVNLNQDKITKAIVIKAADGESIYNKVSISNVQTINGAEANQLSFGGSDIITIMKVNTNAPTLEVSIKGSATPSIDESKIQFSFTANIGDSAQFTVTGVTSINNNGGDDVYTIGSTNQLTVNNAKNTEGKLLIELAVGTDGSKSRVTLDQAKVINPIEINTKETVTIYNTITISNVDTINAGTANKLIIGYGNKITVNNINTGTKKPEIIVSGIASDYTIDVIGKESSNNGVPFTIIAKDDGKIAFSTQAAFPDITIVSDDDDRKITCEALGDPVTMATLKGNIIATSDITLVFSDVTEVDASNKDQLIINGNTHIVIEAQSSSSKPTVEVKVSGANIPIHGKDANSNLGLPFTILGTASHTITFDTNANFPEITFNSDGTTPRIITFAKANPVTMANLAVSIIATDKITLILPDVTVIGASAENKLRINANDDSRIYIQPKTINYNPTVQVKAASHDITIHGKGSGTQALPFTILGTNTGESVDTIKFGTAVNFPTITFDTDTLNTVRYFKCEAATGVSDFNTLDASFIVNEYAVLSLVGIKYIEQDTGDDNKYQINDVSDVTTPLIVQNNGKLLIQLVKGSADPNSKAKLDDPSKITKPIEIKAADDNAEIYNEVTISKVRIINAGDAGLLKVINHDNNNGVITIKPGTYKVPTITISGDSENGNAITIKGKTTTGDRALPFTIKADATYSPTFNTGPYLPTITFEGTSQKFECSAGGSSPVTTLNDLDAIFIVKATNTLELDGITSIAHYNGEENPLAKNDYIINNKLRVQNSGTLSIKLAVGADNEYSTALLDQSKIDKLIEITAAAGASIYNRITIENVLKIDASTTDELTIFQTISEEMRLLIENDYDRIIIHKTTNPPIIEVKASATHAITIKGKSAAGTQALPFTILGTNADGVDTITFASQVNFPDITFDTATPNTVRSIKCESADDGTVTDLKDLVTTFIVKQYAKLNLEGITKLNHYDHVTNPIDYYQIGDDSTHLRVQNGGTLSITLAEGSLGTPNTAVLDQDKITKSIQITTADGTTPYNTITISNVAQITAETNYQLVFDGKITVIEDSNKKANLEITLKSQFSTPDILSIRGPASSTNSLDLKLTVSRFAKIVFTDTTPTPMKLLAVQDNLPKITLAPSGDITGIKVFIGTYNDENVIIEGGKESQISKVAADPSLKKCLIASNKDYSDCTNDCGVSISAGEVIHDLSGISGYDQYHTLYIADNTLSATIGIQLGKVVFCGERQIESEKFTTTVQPAELATGATLTLTNVISFDSKTISGIAEGGLVFQTLTGITIKAKSSGLTTSGTNSVQKTDINDKYTVDGLTIDNTANEDTLRIGLSASGSVTLDVSKVSSSHKIVINTLGTGAITNTINILNVQKIDATSANTLKIDDNDLITISSTGEKPVIKISAKSDAALTPNAIEIKGTSNTFPFTIKADNDYPLTFSTNPTLPEITFETNDGETERTITCKLGSGVTSLNDLVATFNVKEKVTLKLEEGGITSIAHNGANNDEYKIGGNNLKVKNEGKLLITLKETATSTVTLDSTKVTKPIEITTHATADIHETNVFTISEVDTINAGTANKLIIGANNEITIDTKTNSNKPTITVSSKEDEYSIEIIGKADSNNGLPFTLEIKANQGTIEFTTQPYFPDITIDPSVSSRTITCTSTLMASLAAKITATSQITLVFSDVTVVGATTENELHLNAKDNTHIVIAKGESKPTVKVQASNTHAIIVHGNSDATPANQALPFTILGTNTNTATGDTITFATAVNLPDITFESNDPTNTNKDNRKRTIKCQKGVKVDSLNALVTKFNVKQYVTLILGGITSIAHNGDNDDDYKIGVDSKLRVITSLYSKLSITLDGGDNSHVRTAVLDEDYINYPIEITAATGATIYNRITISNVETINAGTKDKLTIDKDADDNDLITINKGNQAAPIIQVKAYDNAITIHGNSDATAANQALPFTILGTADSLGDPDHDTITFATQPNLPEITFDTDDRTTPTLRDLTCTVDLASIASLNKLKASFIVKSYVTLKLTEISSIEQITSDNNYYKIGGNNQLTVKNGGTLVILLSKGTGLDHPSKAVLDSKHITETIGVFAADTETIYNTVKISKVRRISDDVTCLQFGHDEDKIFIIKGDHHAPELDLEPDDSLTMSLTDNIYLGGSHINMEYSRDVIMNIDVDNNNNFGRQFYLKRIGENQLNIKVLSDQTLAVIKALFHNPDNQFEITKAHAYCDDANTDTCVIQCGSSFTTQVNPETLVFGDYLCISGNSYTISAPAFPMTFILPFERTTLTFTNVQSYTNEYNINGIQQVIQKESGASIIYKCTAGKYDDSTTCQDCPSGKYSSAGSTTCQVCEAGKYSSEGSSTCQVCEAGKYSSEGSSTCQVCPSGKYSNAGSSSCNIQNLYVFCGDNSQCSYGQYAESNGYHHLNGDLVSDRFEDNSEILIFPQSYANGKSLDISKFNNQKIIIGKGPGSMKLLDAKSLTIEKATVLTGKQDKSTKLEGKEKGSASFPESDNSYLVVSFDDELTIKQEEGAEITKSVALAPQNKEAFITLDKSVDLKKQKFTISTESKAETLTISQKGKTVDNDELEGFIDTTGSSIQIGETTKKGLSGGAIAGIVIACVVVVAAVVVVVILFVLKKNKSSDDAPKI